MAFADIPDPPGKPEITDYDNKSVDLKWRAPKSDNGAKIEKYIAEKRTKKTGDWEKVGEVSSPHKYAHLTVNDWNTTGW